VPSRELYKSEIPLLVISAHLDDAVLSCGALLASKPGSVVATVFAGKPRDSDNPGEWDNLSGFGSATEAIEARRAEDRSALKLLGALWDHGPALDLQYRPLLGERRRIIRNYVEGVTTKYGATRVMIPLGLKHEDHIELRNQALDVYKERQRLEPWFVYVDLPCGAKWPRLIESAKRELQAKGFRLGKRETRQDADLERKAEAVACYESQSKLLFAPRAKRLFTPRFSSSQIRSEDHRLLEST
jgi:LmbE family N-acetylglucosaminyl deacetylase